MNEPKPFAGRASWRAKKHSAKGSFRASRRFSNRGLAAVPADRVARVAVPAVRDAVAIAPASAHADRLLLVCWRGRAICPRLLLREAQPRPEISLIAHPFRQYRLQRREDILDEVLWFRRRGWRRSIRAGRGCRSLVRRGIIPDRNIGEILAIAVGEA